MSFQIRIWPFSDAPKHLQELSTNGGDEDWLALIPPSYNGQVPEFISENSWFGCCARDEYLQEDGSVVCIGSHA